MAYTATIQQIQRNSNTDSLDIAVRYDGSGISAGNSIVKTYHFDAASMPDKPTFKAFVAANIQAMNAFDAQVNFLNGKIGADVSTI